MGTINVLEACRKAGVRKIVFASTSGVYGDLEKSQLTEDDPVNQSPSMPYPRWQASNISAYTTASSACSTPFFVMGMSTVRSDCEGKAVLWRYLVTACVKVLRFIYTAMASKPGTSFMSRMLLKQTSPPFNTGRECSTCVSTGTGHTVNSLVDHISRLHSDRIDVHYLPAKNGDILHSA